MTDAVGSTLQLAPLVIAGFFIGGLVGWRAARFRRLYGRSPIHRPQRGDTSAHAFLSRMLVVYFGALVALALAAALVPAALERLDPLYARRTGVLFGAGLALATAAAAIVWRAQDDMAASWRIGVDPSERTELVTRGLFQFCRNPIYLGLQLALIAFVGLVPGYLTLTLLVTACLLFQVQARLEEAFLLAHHGDVYARYCHRVGRFLPWTGRWPEAAPRAQS